MTSFRPDFDFLPKKITLRLLNIYQAFLLRCPDQRPIRPVFLWDPELAEDMTMKVEQLDLAIIPILTGRKIKHTREYMEQFMTFLKEKQWVCLATMQRHFFQKVVDEGKYTRQQTLTLQANYLRRMNCASLVSRSKPCTRVDWNECYQHLHQMNMNEYISMMKFALDLPKEWCDDEALRNE